MSPEDLRAISARARRASQDAEAASDASFAARRDWSTFQDEMKRVHADVAAARTRLLLLASP